MATARLFKETSIPGSFQANGMYLVKTGNRLRVLVADNTGSAYAATITDAEIQTMIDNAMAAAGSQQSFVADTIADRDALNPTGMVTVVVLDATADPEVQSGSATYMWLPSQGIWHKTSESESMDVVQNWINIAGRPTSLVSEIDDAVSKKHTHSNITELNKIGENGSGNFTYGGVRPRTPYETTNW